MFNDRNTRNTRTEMYAGRVACCAVVSHVGRAQVIFFLSIFIVFCVIIFLSTISVNKDIIIIKVI